MKTYTIKQGNHYSSGLHFRLHSGLEKLEFKTLLHADCLYHFGNNDDQDINKVYGITWGLLNDKFSFRIGWSCINNDGTITYYAYAHENGAMVWQPLFSVAPETVIDFTIVFNRDINQIFIYSTVVTVPTVLDFNFNGVANYGYYNYPYFGGNNVAPHNMTIGIE